MNLNYFKKPALKKLESISYNDCFSFYFTKKQFKAIKKSSLNYYVLIIELLLKDDFIKTYFKIRLEELKFFRKEGFFFKISLTTKEDYCDKNLYQEDFFKIELDFIMDSDLTFLSKRFFSNYYYDEFEACRTRAFKEMFWKSFISLIDNLKINLGNKFHLAKL